MNDELQEKYLTEIFDKLDKITCIEKSLPVCLLLLEGFFKDQFLIAVDEIK